MSFLVMSPRRPSGREQSMPRGAFCNSLEAAVVSAVDLELKSSTIAIAWWAYMRVFVVQNTHAYVAVWCDDVLPVVGC